MKSTNETQALAHEILAYWLRFNRHEQESWIGDPYGFEISQELLPTGALTNVCNTTLCAAGTAVFLSNSPRNFKDFVRYATFNDWKEKGGTLLGLDSKESGLVFLSDEESAKRYMQAIANGSQKEFDKATKRRVEIKGARTDC